MSTTELTINEPNIWRLRTPGHASWPRSARPGDPRKYFLVSADAHANEPADLWATRIDVKYRDRVPKVIVDANGVKWRVSEGHRRTGCAPTSSRARTGCASSPAPIPNSACATWIATASTPR